VENYTEAEKVFRKYTQLIPNDPNPHDSYAELLLKIGKFDESITNYQKALAVDPNFVASYSGLAMNYMQKGMVEKADEALDQLTMKARNNGERRLALFGKIVLAADAGKFERALEVLDKEYALSEEDHDPSQMATDLVFRGNILVEMGKFDDAGASYAKSLELIDASGLSQKVKDNAHLVQHFNLVAVYVGKNDLKSAKAEAEQFRKGAVANNNPNQLRGAHELAGVIALAEKKYTNAIAELKQANLQNPQNLYRLGVAYAGKAEKAKAKEYYGKAAHFNGLPGLNYAFVRAKSLKMVDSIS
jgi:tetratricopeptide (TPR) repeat protein